MAFNEVCTCESKGVTAERQGVERGECKIRNLEANNVTASRT
jgi:hypothetical protein